MRPQSMIRHLLAGAALLLLATQVSGAQTEGADEADPHGGRRHGPPPAEALAACKTLKDGDLCTFNSPVKGAISGVCKARGDRPLACRPDKPADAGAAAR